MARTRPHTRSPPTFAAEWEQIDRWRNNAKVFADHDALLKLIEDDYPPALLATFNCLAQAAKQDHEE